MLKRFAPVLLAFVCGGAVGWASRAETKSAIADVPSITHPDPVLNISRTTDAKVDYFHFRVYRTRVSGNQTDFGPVPGEGNRWVIRVNNDYHIYAERVDNP